MADLARAKPRHLATTGGAGRGVRPGRRHPKLAMPLRGQLVAVVGSGVTKAFNSGELTDVNEMVEVG